MTDRMIGNDELERGARAVYTAARSNIAAEPWERLPEWRKLRWKTAYLDAIGVHREYARPARTLRLEAAS